MPSFRTTVTPSRRAAARFVQDVRRAIQKALAEEEAKRGLTQSDIARAIGVHRSVINREIRGYKDLTLGRVAELAWAMGRMPEVDLPEKSAPHGSSVPLDPPPKDTMQDKPFEVRSSKGLVRGRRTRVG